MNQVNEIRRLRRALVYALEAFEQAAETHACDYCRADAREIGRALDGADIMDPHAVLADMLADPSRAAKQKGATGV